MKEWNDVLFCFKLTKWNINDQQPWCNEFNENTYKIIDLVSQAWFYWPFIYQFSNLQALDLFIRLYDFNNAVFVTKVIIFHVSVQRFQVITIALHLTHIYDYKPITTPCIVRDTRKKHDILSLQLTGIKLSPWEKGNPEQKQTSQFRNLFPNRLSECFRNIIPLQANLLEILSRQRSKLNFFPLGMCFRLKTQFFLSDAIDTSTFFSNISLLCNVSHETLQLLHQTKRAGNWLWWETIEALVLSLSNKDRLCTLCKLILYMNLS